MKVAGLDLAGKPENPTGFCIMSDEGSETKLLYSDEEIIKNIDESKPACIAIDAPFWLPRAAMGRIPPWRKCDQLLLKRGFRPLSVAMPTMQQLAMRANSLIRQLRSKGYVVIETFPRAAEAVLGLSKEPRKNQDEYDALLCALAAKSFVEKKFEDLDGIIIPR